jgi:hypothetical protein
VRANVVPLQAGLRCERGAKGGKGGCALFAFVRRTHIFLIALRAVAERKPSCLGAQQKAVGRSAMTSSAEARKRGAEAEAGEQEPP